VSSHQLSLPAGSESWWLLTSDWHWDNPLCQRDLLAKNLNEARERNARVLVFGDLFCAMEGRGDPRGSKNLRPEHVGEDYLDLLVDTFAEWIEPYKDLMSLITYGNHETSVRDKKETDLLARVSALTGIALGRYDGWIRWLAWTGAGDYACAKAYYHHGYGGGGPVTKGIIATNRRLSYVEGADLIITGHVHESWVLETIQERCTHIGTLARRTISHVQLPTYKQESVGDGYHTQRGRPPKPLGGWWLCLYHERQSPGRLAWRLSRAD